MQGNDLLNKLSHNKKFLFIIPNLIYIFTFLYFYNSNFDSGLEVLFSEVILLSLVFFGISTFVYLFLMKALKDPQKVFCIQCFISMFYFVRFNLVLFLLFIVMVLILIIDFKKLIKFKLDDGVCIISFIIIFLFLFNFFTSFSNVMYMVVNSKSYDNKIDVNIDDDLETPNIYYIHCDAMMGLDAMKKYFNHDDGFLSNYFVRNDYYLNKDASLVTGHNTQRTLVALFNPNYYDEFYKDYVLDLEKVYLEKKDKTDFVVDYYELEDKRLNNELFKSLEEKGYDTVAIAEYNAYTSLDVDYYYDYYYYDDHVRYIEEDRDEFRVLEDNSDLKLLSYIRFVHSKPLLTRTMLSNVLRDVNFLNYDEIDYNSFDSGDSKYIDRAMEDNHFWLSKAILKGLNLSFETDNNRFVFVDFRLAHEPYTFGYNGNIYDELYQYSLDAYLSNYIYSSYLLVETLEYIKNNDEDAVIIVQGDHGIHTKEDEEIINYFNVDNEGVQEIRNSVISAMYIPDKYKNGDEEYLDNPLNISRYLVNNYVGDNYEYLDK